MNDFTVESLTDFFSYLDDLRASGVTNMFGAGPYLTEIYGLPPNDARTVLQFWMQASRDLTPHERAVMAGKQQP